METAAWVIGGLILLYLTAEFVRTWHHDTRDSD